MTKYTVETADGFADIEADGFKVDPDGCLALTKTGTTTERVAVFAPGQWISVVKDGYDLTESDDERPFGVGVTGGTPEDIPTLRGSLEKMGSQLEASYGELQTSSLDERIAEAMQRM